MTEPKIRVLIADDHAVLRAGLRMLLDAEPDIEVVGEARDGLEVLARVRTLTPDVLLLDLAMPGMGGWRCWGGSGRCRPRPVC